MIALLSWNVSLYSTTITYKLCTSISNLSCTCKSRQVYHSTNMSQIHVYININMLNKCTIMFYRCTTKLKVHGCYLEYPEQFLLK